MTQGTIEKLYTSHSLEEGIQMHLTNEELASKYISMYTLVRKRQTKKNKQRV